MKKYFIAIGQDWLMHTMVYNLILGAELALGRGAVQVYAPGSTARCICFLCNHARFVSGLGIHLSNFGLKVEVGQ